MVELWGGIGVVEGGAEPSRDPQPALLTLRGSSTGSGIGLGMEMLGNGQIWPLGTRLGHWWPWQCWDNDWTP